MSRQNQILFSGKNYTGGSTRNQIIVSSSVNPNGEIVVCGSHGQGSTGPNSSLGLSTRIGTVDGYVAKFKADGTFLWSFQIGGSGATVTVRSVAFGDDGHVYVAGLFSGANLTAPSITKTGTVDAFIFKLDKDTGALIWSTVFYGTAATIGIAYNHRALVFDYKDNHVYLVCGTANNLTVPAITKVGTTDALVIKVDSSGTIVWTSQFGGSGVTSSGGQLALNLDDNNYITALLTRNGQWSVPSTTSGGSNTIITPVKLAKSDGSMSLYANYGSNTGVTLDSICAHPNGIYMSMNWAANNLTVPPVGFNSTTRTILLKLDSSFAYEWFKLGEPASTSGQIYSGNLTEDGLGGCYWSIFVNGSVNPIQPASFARLGTQDSPVYRIDKHGNLKNFITVNGSGAGTYVSHCRAVNGYLILPGFYNTQNLINPAPLTLKSAQNAPFLFKFRPRPGTQFLQFFSECETAPSVLEFTNGGSFTNVGSVTTTTGYQGNGWAFANSPTAGVPPTQYLTWLTGDVSQFATVYTYTLRCYVRLNNTAWLINQVFMSKWDGGSGSCFVFGYRKSSGRMFFSTRNGASGTDVLEVPLTIVAGTLYEVEATYNTSTKVKTLRVTVVSTGVPTVATQTVASHINGSAPMLIGANAIPALTEGLDGMLDNVYFGVL